MNTQTWRRRLSPIHILLFCATELALDPGWAIVCLMIGKNPENWNPAAGMARLIPRLQAKLAVRRGMVMRCVLFFALLGILTFVHRCLSWQSQSPIDYLIAEFHTGQPTGALVFSKSGDVLVAAGGVKQDDKYVLLRWDVKRKIPLKKVETDFTSYIAFLDRSPDGQSIVAADGNGNVAVFREAGKQIARFRLFEQTLNNILDVRFLNDDEVVTVSGESVIERRNFRTNIRKLYYQPGRAPTGATIAITADAIAWVNDRTVCLWKPMLREDSCPIKLFAPDNRHSFVACSDDAATILCGTSDSNMELYDVKMEKPIRTWNAHRRATLGALISLKERKGFVSASEAGEIKLWGAAGQATATVTLGDGQTVYGIASNQDSTLLAVGTENKILLLDIRRLRRIQKETKCAHYHCARQVGSDPFRIKMAFVCTSALLRPANWYSHRASP
jgi:WD40 repeat protein